MAALNRDPAVMREKLKTGAFREELALGLEMFKKGKLRLIPRKVGRMEKIREVCRKEQGGGIR